jgi:hypothetical protein
MNQIWTQISLIIVFAMSMPAAVLQGAESVARDIATHAEASVLLKVNDNFQQINDTRPAGTVFRVASGVHIKQRVVNPKKGNQWIGEEGAILDGKDALSDAFHGKAERVTIQGLELRNYVDNGVYFTSGSDIVINQVTVRDTGSGDGEANGAIRFANVSDLAVTRSHFTRVSSGVLPTECKGPIRIEWNTGVNTGRNYVQLDKCTGGGIRVRYNTMERVGNYLRPDAQDVEDWISVYKVNGRPDDPAQFSYNRARGHGPSKSGSFIMLGDGGGRYLEAIGNVGVTPGQVGIGLCGGEHIEVRSNLMYSKVWPQSNIAYYSCNYSRPSPCGEHIIKDNRANWINRDGKQNTFWTDGNAEPLTMNGNCFPDNTLSEKIWDQWEVDINRMSNRTDAGDGL